MSKKKMITNSMLKKVGLNIKERFKAMNMRRYLLKLTVFLFVLVCLAVIFLIPLIRRYEVEPRPAYDKTGFIPKSEFAAETISFENSRFAFQLFSDSTHFSISDKKYGVTWTSHPKGELSQINADAREVFLLYYERKLKEPGIMSVNQESIHYDQYAFRINETENSIEILYEVGGKHGLSMDDLPRMLPVEKVEERIIPRLQELAEDDSTVYRILRFFQIQYVKMEGEGEPYYYLRETSSQDALQMIYDALFTYGGYTETDLMEDRIRFNLPEPSEILRYEFSVKYTLKEDGLEIRLVNDSIVEPKDNPIAYIDILPYFGSGNASSEGYMMIPDGSGVLIDFNNNKYNNPPYYKRIYGKDYAIRSTTLQMPEEEEDISLPLYGMYHDGYGFIHVVENGAPMTAIRSGFRTFPNDKHPYAYYRYFLRERDAYTFVGTYTTQEVKVWTEEFNREDFVSKIMFLDGEDQGYTGMAKEYQDYLIQKGLLTPIADDTRGAMNITLLGGYKKRDYILGIPYLKVDALTDVDEAKIIVDELLSNDVNRLNITYQGWVNGGLKPTYMDKLSFNRVIGKKEEFIAFNDYLTSQNIRFIPEVYANTAFTDKRIKVKDDVIYNLLWETVERYDFNLATMLPDRSTTPIYTLLPTKAPSLVQKLSKYFNQMGFEAIGFIDFGNELSSSFHKDNVLFRLDAEQAFIDAMNNNRDHFNFIMVRNPDYYALPYVDLALDVPSTGTQFRIVDQSVPFVQLVFNGYIDYSGKAINLDDRYSLHWHLLKAIETGSSLHFTWSYKDTIDLTHTEYSEYFSTYYQNWLEQAVEMYHTLHDLGIYEARLIDHEFASLDGSTVIVRYDNGLTIKVDYDTLTYEVLEEVKS